MKKNIFYFLATFVFSIITIAASAQSGRIIGVVYEKESRTPVEGATISVEKANKNAVSTTTGTFIIPDVANGVYNINVTHVSYQPTKITDVNVSATSTDTVFVLLEDKAGTNLNEVVVTTAARSKESFAALNIERKRSTIVVQKIGADEMATKGISNVGEGVSKVVGVAMSGNNSLFVRGLGDRYNIATLNGLPIPSTNPDEKLIPLDIFPSAIVQNIAVVKSYTSPYYGDFSGGTIDVVTKVTPSRPFFTIGVSAGMNSITTGKDFFVSKDQSFMQKMGFGKGERAFPANYRNVIADPNNINNFSFNTPWSPELTKAPIDYGFSLSGGKTFDLENNTRLGLIFSGRHKNEFRYSYGTSALYNANKNPSYLYETQNFLQGNNTTAMLGLNLLPGKNNNSYSWNTLFVNDASTNIYNGIGEDKDLGDVIFRRNTFIQNTLLSSQFSGKNRLSNEISEINWAAGYTKTLGAMPDRVTTGFNYGSNNTYAFINRSAGDRERYSYGLDDNEAVAKIEYMRRPKESVINNYKVGVDGKYKFRTFDVEAVAANINNIQNQSVDINNIDAVLTPNNIGTGSGEWSLLSAFNPTNNYEANLGIVAPYVDFNFNWNNKWTLQAGLRAEMFKQTTFYRRTSDAADIPYRESVLDGVSLLPGATLKYLINSKSNVLFAASRTMIRPLFVETAPFRLNAYAGTVETAGNPELKNSSVYNADLKYEFYPSNDQIMAVSLFGKYIQNPIERMQVASSEEFFSYINSEYAVVAGIEVEFYRNLASLFNSSSDVLDNMTVGINGSYMYTNIKIDPEKVRESTIYNISPTNTTRPLFGASPYLLNIDYTYKANWSENSFSTFAITYNVFGKRLFVAGAVGAGDVYEMPVNTLNAAINTQISKNWNVSLDFKNILNPTIEYNQEFSDEDLQYSSFKSGVDMSIGVSYTF